ncbi:hypothetical protein [Pseudobutyrivibrio ruminis]|uniref:Uncharacterized protein n=1 Tax=Pseudobutyrivibrio ruminis TaxID=46206 RepID=A0A2G3DXB2_9FIRM|nr:hypothetical protein [Pseudobutyrivibrio ruminis]PHU35510.1 hypothetical protein CSX01_02610 [Pseudobutyrivibrio ruminis]
MANLFKKIKEKLRWNSKSRLNERPEERLVRGGTVRFGEVIPDKREVEINNAAIDSALENTGILSNNQEDIVNDILSAYGAGQNESIRQEFPPRGASLHRDGKDRRLRNASTAEANGMENNNTDKRKSENYNRPTADTVQRTYISPDIRQAATYNSETNPQRWASLNYTKNHGAMTISDRNVYSSYIHPDKGMAESYNFSTDSDTASNNISDYRSDRSTNSEIGNGRSAQAKGKGKEVASEETISSRRSSSTDINDLIYRELGQGGISSNARSASSGRDAGTSSAPKEKQLVRNDSYQQTNNQRRHNQSIGARKN